MFARNLLHSREEYLLLADVLGISQEKLFLDVENIRVPDNCLHQFLVYLKRLKKGEPISKIIHKRAFWNSEFFVNEDVLDPRPETELIIETVLHYVATDRNVSILDLGTGSGCIILSLLQEYRGASGVGIDISEKAIHVAEINKCNLKIDKVDFYNTSWNNYIPENKFDVVVSNPPYIRTNDIQKLDVNVKNYDPIIALDGGVSGLKCYREIISIASNLLNDHGFFVCEVGYDQAKEVADILSRNYFQEINIHKDLCQVARVVSGIFSKIAF